MDEIARFRCAYADLEARMRDQARVDGDIYLPNPEPSGPVEHVLICMEPSLGAWASSPDDARQIVQRGFRNFLHSLEDFILHHAASEFLCAPGERYHVTDVSKGAMLVKHAGQNRIDRYETWYSLLREELDLIAKPAATIVAVGRAVFEFLERRHFPGSVSRILHYSGQAARGRNRAIVGHERAFQAFAERITHAEILDTAREALSQAGVPPELRSATIRRIEGHRLTESRKKLLFSYKMCFEALRN